MCPDRGWMVFNMHGSKYCTSLWHGRRRLPTEFVRQRNPTCKVRHRVPTWYNKCNSRVAYIIVLILLNRDPVSLVVWKIVRHRPHPVLRWCKQTFTSLITSELNWWTRAQRCGFGYSWLRSRSAWPSPQRTSDPTRAGRTGRNSQIGETSSKRG